MDLEIYQVFPNIDEEYFELGFDGKKTYQNVHAKRTLKFPKCYSIGTYVTATTAPEYGVLYLDKSYNFEFYIPRGLGVAIIDAQDDWTYFDRQKGVFKLQYVPTTEGRLKVSVKYNKGGNSYWSLMIYNVKGPKIIS